MGQKILLGAAMLLVFALGQRAMAQSPLPDLSRQMEAIGAQRLWEELPPAAAELLSSMDLEELHPGALLGLSPGDLFKMVRLSVRRQLLHPVRVLGVVLGTVLLCALMEGLREAMGDPGLSEIFQVVSVLTVTAALVQPVLQCIRSTGEAISQCNLFFTSFLPIFSGVMAAGGQPMTASAFHGVLFVACQGAAQLASSVLVPLLGVCLALCITGALLPGKGPASAAGAVKTAVTWTLGLLLSLLVGFLSVQTLVAGAGDTVTAKTTKFLIGSFIPVAGSALSDAFLAAQGCIRLLRTTLGGFGILAAAAIFLPILLKTVLWYLSLRLASAAGELLGVDKTAGLLASLASVLAILLSVILSFVLLVVVSTAILILGVGL